MRCWVHGASPTLAFAAGAFLLIHSLTPHKEFRFLLPAFPLLAALGALGLDELRRLPPLVLRSATVTVIAVALLSGATLPWSSGHKYLDQTVPIFAAGGPGPAYYNYGVVDEDHLAANPPLAEAYLVKRDHDWILFRSSPSCRLTAPPNAGL